MQSDFAIMIDKRPVKNFWKGRGGFLPIAIVERMIQGSIEDAESFFDGRRPEGEFAVSAHYAVARDGRVWQFVDDEDTAWSNGVLQNPEVNVGWLREVYQEKVNCNLVTLSIDYEGYSGEALSPEQYHAALALHRQLVQRWEIETDAQHIIGQNLIDTVERAQNPGPAFPFDQLLQDLQTAPAEPAVATEEMSFENEPLPATESIAPLPQAVEIEEVAAYQPEMVEAPAYRPQVEAFNFTPGLNYEVDQVTAQPEEVNPATAEPEPVESEPATLEPFTLDLFTTEETQAEPSAEPEPFTLDQFAPEAAEEVPTQAVEPSAPDSAWQLPESLEFTDSAETPVTGEEPSALWESPKTGSEESDPVAPDAAWESDFLSDIPPFRFDEEPSNATIQAEESAEPATAEAAQESEVAPAISDMVTPKSDSQIFNYTIAPATPFSMPSIVDFESEESPAVETPTFAEQVAAASQAEPEPAVEKAEFTAVPEAALEATTSAHAAEDAAEKPVEVKAPAPAPAVEPEKPKEKHHWYDRIKSLFVHEEKPAAPAKPVQPQPTSFVAVPAEPVPVPQQAVEAEPDVEIAPTAPEETQAEPAAEPEIIPVEAATQAEAVIVNEPVESEVTDAVEAAQVEPNKPEEVEAEAATEAEETQVEPETVATEMAAEPETVEVEAATAVEEPETAPAIEAEVITAEIVKAAEVAEEAAPQAEPASEPVESEVVVQADEAEAQPQTTGGMEAIEAELDAWPGLSEAKPSTEMTSTEAEPAIEAVSQAEPAPVQAGPEAVEAEPEAEAPSAEAAIQVEPQSEPETAQVAPVVEADTRPEPQSVQPEPPEEESFYPFELDNQPTTNYSDLFRAESVSEPAGYDFRPGVQPSTFDQDFEFQDLNGPSDYPFDLPETSPRPQNFNPVAEPSRPQTFDVAPEPLQFEENAPASEPIAPPLFRETSGGTSGLVDTGTQATGPHGFAYDDLELPAWLEEPEQELPAPSAPPAFAPEPPKKAGLDIPADPNAFAFASSPYAQDEQTPGWLQKPDEATEQPGQFTQPPAFNAPEPAQPLIQPALKDTPAVPLPNKDWQDESLFGDDDFASLLNQSGFDLFQGETREPAQRPAQELAQRSTKEPAQAGTAPAQSQSQTVPPMPDFDNIFAEDEPPPPAKPTLRQLIDRNDGYTAPLSYEDLDMSVPLDLEEDTNPPGGRKPLVPAQDRKDGPSFGDDFFENEPYPAYSAAPAPTPPVQNDPPGFNRVNLGGGQISVELANIRVAPSYDKSTILRVAEQGERFEFDGWMDGPELRSSTRWYRIGSGSDEGWIHSTLVALDQPFRA